MQIKESIPKNRWNYRKSNTFRVLDNNDDKDYIYKDDNIFLDSTSKQIEDIKFANRIESKQQNSLKWKMQSIEKEAAVNQQEIKEIELLILELQEENATYVERCRILE